MIDALAKLYSTDENERGREIIEARRHLAAVKNHAQRVLVDNDSKI
jgi:hypothetical protein